MLTQFCVCFLCGGTSILWICIFSVYNTLKTLCWEQFFLPKDWTGEESYIRTALDTSWAATLITFTVTLAQGELVIGPIPHPCGWPAFQICRTAERIQKKALNLWLGPFSSYPWLHPAQKWTLCSHPWIFPPTSLSPIHALPLCLGVHNLAWSPLTARTKGRSPCDLEIGLRAIWVRNHRNPKSEWRHRCSGWACSLSPAHNHNLEKKPEWSPLNHKVQDKGTSCLGLRMVLHSKNSIIFLLFASYFTYSTIPQGNIHGIFYSSNLFFYMPI